MNDENAEPYRKILEIIRSNDMQNMRIDGAKTVSEIGVFIAEFCIANELGPEYISHDKKDKNAIGVTFSNESFVISFHLLNANQKSDDVLEAMNSRIYEIMKSRLSDGLESNVEPITEANRDAAVEDLCRSSLTALLTIQIIVARHPDALQEAFGNNEGLKENFLRAVNVTEAWKDFLEIRDV